MKKSSGIIVLLIYSLTPGRSWAALNSYSFWHVSIDTIWLIFLFLLFFILAPFILLAIVYWRKAVKKTDDAQQLDHD